MHNSVAIVRIGIACLQRYPLYRMQYKGPPLYLLLSCCRSCMDQNTLDWIWIATGALILLYVAICLLSQKVWINKTLSWGTKEDYPKTFQMNIIGGILSGLFLLACPFLW